MADIILDMTTTSVVLMKILNFAVTPKLQPVEDIICNVESVFTFWGNIYLTQRKIPFTTSLELKALKLLLNNDKIVVTTMDKENATLITKTTHYKAKIKSSLKSNNPYKD